MILPTDPCCPAPDLRPFDRSGAKGMVCRACKSWASAGGERWTISPLPAPAKPKKPAKKKSAVDRGEKFRDALSEIGMAYYILRFEEKVGVPDMIDLRSRELEHAYRRAISALYGNADEMERA